jgi:hypothetical protein
MDGTFRRLFLSLSVAMLLAWPLRAGAQSGATDPLPAGLNWPVWRGNGHGTATAERLQKLVESLDKVRLIWTSEACFGEPACSKGYDVLGGHGGLIVYDNRFYLGHYRGGGEVFKGG